MNYHKIAKEIYYLSYTGDDKNFRKKKIQEIEDWLIDGCLDDTASIEKLYSEWEEYDSGEAEIDTPEEDESIDLYG